MIGTPTVAGFEMYEKGVDTTRCCFCKSDNIGPYSVFCKACESQLLLHDTVICYMCLQIYSNPASVYVTKYNDKCPICCEKSQ